MSFVSVQKSLCQELSPSGNMSLEILTAPPALILFYSVNIFPMAQLKEKDIKLSSDFKSVVSLTVLMTVKWLDFFLP